MTAGIRYPNTPEAIIGAPEQPPALSFGVELGPCLTIAGVPGTWAEIRWAVGHGGTKEWATLANVELTSLPQEYHDRSSPAGAARVDQAVLGQPSMIWIPPGTFTMGSPAGEQDRESDEGPQTRETSTEGFFFGKHEVTQGEYLAAMGTNPSYFTEETNRPVEHLSWFDATNYCGQLTARMRLAGWLPAR